MYNKYVFKSDFPTYRNYILDNKIPEKYPLKDKDHALYNTPDCYTKWASILMMFDEIKSDGMKVVDLGTGEGPLPHIISEQGYDVVGVDNMRVDHPFGPSLVVMVLKDAIEFFRDIEDESVDVFTDSCSVTHFNFGGGQNPGWKSVFSGVYQKLKPGGYFLVATDCHFKSERKRDGEFLLGEEIAATAKECGFTLTPEFNDDKMEVAYRNAGRETDLSVATFMLKK
jgi:SAM-dependent methyltransferase